jgi:hypothetical protein
MAVREVEIGLERLYRARYPRALRMGTEILTRGSDGQVPMRRASSTVSCTPPAPSGSTR